MLGRESLSRTRAVDTSCDDFTPDQQVEIGDLVPDGVTGAVRDFHGYWLRARGTRRMPSFRDIDPVDIPWALSRIFVIDALPGGDFRYRLAGEEIARRYNQPMKGARIGDIMEDASAVRITSWWRLIVDRRVASFVITDHPSRTGVPVSGIRLTLPLSDDGDTVTQLLGFTHFIDRREGFHQIVGRHHLKSMTWAPV